MGNSLTPAEASDADLLAYIRNLHRRSDVRVGDFYACASSGHPHPRETYRAACGRPGWPRDVGKVLAEAELGSGLDHSERGHS